jgi:hypothetical protein
VQYVAGFGALLCSYSVIFVPVLAVLFAAIEPGLSYFKTGQTLSAKYAGISEVKQWINTQNET